jgi:hypothetical protein
MPEQIPVPLPFRVEFDPAKREVVVSMTYGVGPIRRCGARSSVRWKRS